MINPPRVLCIGETMGVVTSADATPLADADLFTLSAGGAESNVAQHLAALGVATAWASALGADTLGDRILEALGDSGVDTRWVRRDPSAPTGLYLKDPGGGVYYYRSGSAASRLGPADAVGWPIAAAEWIHLSGITPALGENSHALISRLIDLARSVGTLVSFDINHRPGLWPAARAAHVLRPLADRADLVLVGLDEAHRLWGTRSAAEVADVMPTPKLLVVKDGAREAVELDRTQAIPTITRVPAHKVDVVEEVGAGDAFAAGYLAGVLGDKPAERRLALGHALAAWTLGSAADHRPLTDRSVST